MDIEPVEKTLSIQTDSEPNSKAKGSCENAKKVSCPLKSSANADPDPMITEKSSELNQNQEQTESKNINVHSSPKKVSVMDILKKKAISDVSVSSESSPTTQPSSSVTKKDSKKSEATTPKSKQTKSAKAKSPSSNKPTYMMMTHNALVKLGDRNGSSLPAIYKMFFSLYDKPDEKQTRNLIQAALKNGIKQDRFIKIRCSYKVNVVWVKKQKEEQKKKERKKKQAAKKKSQGKAVGKVKAENSDGKEVIKETEKERKKRIAEEEKKLLAERIRKRKFPMDDRELIKEDKELKVKCPVETPRPSLPLVIPSNPSLNVSINGRGLISDVLVVFHFIRGDLGFFRETFPSFTISNLIECAIQIHKGNAKQNTSLPPLIVFLFYTILDHILSNSQSLELVSLSKVLSYTNWSEILRQYLYAMQNYSTSNLSEDNVTDLVSENMKEDNDNDQEEFDDDDDDLPANYHGYLGPRNQPLHKAYDKLKKYDAWMLNSEETFSLLRTLCDDILGSDESIMRDLDERAEHMNKLSKERKAAESHYRKMRLAFEGPKNFGKSTKKKKESENSSNNDTSNKGETKEKAEVKGKAKDKDQEKVKDNDSKSDAKEQKETVPQSNEPAKEIKGFKPTISKKKFLESEKELSKAVEAYDEGINKYPLRTQPHGYDRNFSAIYHFHHDPKQVYIEAFPKSHDPESLSNNLISSTWKTISNKSVFDKYTSSLDVRGKRESFLENELTYKGIVKKHLFDDYKVQNYISSKIREEETLMKKIENARDAVGESSRRSGRLVGQAQAQLQTLEDELKSLKEQNKTGSAPTDPKPNVDELMGTILVEEFENNMERDQPKSDSLGLKSSSFWKDEGNSLVIESITRELLEIDERCNQVAAWENDSPREQWIGKLQTLAKEWKAACQLRSSTSSSNEASLDQDLDVVESYMSPPISKRSKRRSEGSTGSSRSTKKSKIIDAFAPKVLTYAGVLAKLKQPLLDLEERIMSISGMLITSKDEEYKDNGQDTFNNDGTTTCSDVEWKRTISRLNKISSKRISTIREILISAIALARDSDLTDVVTDLRAALKLHRPTGAGNARTAALKVLSKYGGFDKNEHAKMTDEKTESEVLKESEDTGLGNTLLISEDARCMLCHLEKTADISRKDWRESVKSCKTLSRISAFTNAFVDKAIGILDKLDVEKMSLIQVVDYWKANLNKDGTKKSKSKKGKTKNIGIKYTPEINVWGHSSFSQDCVMVKVSDDMPWWPARICILKDESIQESFEEFKRSLVSLVGDGRYFIVDKNSQIKSCCDEIDDEDSTQYSKMLMTKRDECMSVMKRITSPMKINMECDPLEEKKLPG